MPALLDLNTLTLPELFAELARDGAIRRLLELARDEDLGPRGDVTSAAWIEGSPNARAALRAREGGIVAGLAVLPALIDVFGSGPRIITSMNDGEACAAGQTLARFEGPLAGLLALERTMLNLVTRLSGVATLTRRYVAAMGEGHKARLFDTRKTTPGLRAIEKYAVRCGGGCCHRIGLHDAVLIKDNHLAGIAPAELPARLARAASAARAAGPLRFIEVEADTLEQFDLFLAAPAGSIDIVLLDNMPVPQLVEAIRRRDAGRPGLLLEASGGVNLDTIGAIARTGVDRISVGAITHAARGLDLGLDIVS